MAATLKRSSREKLDNVQGGPVGPPPGSGGQVIIGTASQVRNVELGQYSSLTEVRFLNFLAVTSKAHCTTTKVL